MTPPTGAVNLFSHIDHQETSIKSKNNNLKIKSLHKIVVLRPIAKRKAHL
ncbi:hypothetical protein LEP1GSC076_0459 [Leptospira sp. Fiocruz LV4135]|nr:hypothetical protein LEP1GSC076_0459 [Leptospira sp. Fiocruz LV4135]